jgi:hypothetical protein
MFGFEKVDLSFSFNPIVFVLMLLLLGGFTLFVYRYTVPVINIPKKILLVFVRFAALIVLLFIVFEPMLTLAKKIVLNPVNLVFIDNSRSILIEDGTNRDELIKNFISDLGNVRINGELELHTFGNRVNKTGFSELNNIEFNEGSTNFSNIFSSIDKQGKNIASVVIISDGVITDGTNPVYTAEKMSIPVYTIGVGDSAARNDVEIKNVLFNRYIYAETPTTILATISNTGFGNKSINVSLYEQDLLVEQKNIILNPDGIQNVEFSYNPKSGGEKKLTIAASNLEGEFTYANNRKVFYVNVLSNKINVLVLAGSPSPDLSFIKNTLKTDENFRVNSLTQISQNKFLENENPERLLDSADILFLIGFPSKETSDDFLNKVSEAVKEKNKPFFISFSQGIDFIKLSRLQGELPFNFSVRSTLYNEVQPNISGEQVRNPLLQNNAANHVAAWENLPPVFQPDVDITVKLESELISRIKVNNIPSNRPLIVTRTLGSKRSAAVLAKDFWRWKLQTAARNSDLFDRFIMACVKWLNTSEVQKQVRIAASKKVYSLGEEIEFTGQVYDATFNPVSDAEVKVRISGADENYEVQLSSVGNGLYEGVFQTGKPGDYSFSGEAKIDNQNFGKDAGSFNIGEVDIEMMNPRMNYEFLRSLAERTGGEYFTAENYNDLFPVLQQINERASGEKIETSEINLWSNEWLMIIIVLLFGIEWFLRKRAGML